MKMTRALQIGLFALVGMMALFGLYGCDIEEIIASAGGNIEAVREIAQVYDIATLADLTIESSNGEVIVTSAETTSVSVVARMRSRADTLEKAEERVNSLTIEMVQTGDNVLLRYRSADQSLDVRKYSGVSFEVTVPAQADVTVDTSNGSITVSGVEGEFKLDTSNGSIDLNDLVGVVYADTSNGRIDVDGFRGELDLETSNGVIDIEDVEALVDARTSNGRINFSGVLVGDHHSLRTSNGAIEVKVNVNTSLNFEASTSIGSISTNLPLVGDTEGRTWNAALNPPTTQTLELRTSNGSIRIEAE